MHQATKQVDTGAELKRVHRARLRWRRWRRRAWRAPCPRRGGGRPDNWRRDGDGWVDDDRGGNGDGWVADDRGVGDGWSPDDWGVGDWWSPDDGGVGDGRSPDDWGMGDGWSPDDGGVGDGWSPDDGGVGDGSLGGFSFMVLGLGRLGLGVGGAVATGEDGTEGGNKEHEG